MVKHYIQIYLKHHGLLAFLCALITFLPLFIVSLIYDVLSYDIWISFVPFGVALIWVASRAMYTIRFRTMIRQQEDIYGVTFRDDGVRRLAPTLFLAKDWLIRAGNSAFYKAHVQSVKQKVHHDRGGLTYRLTVTTKDSRKYVFWCHHEDSARRIKRWCSK